jgi:hypothetical protein
MLLTVVLEHDHRTHAVVVGKQESERSDHEVEIAIAVDIDGFDVRRGGHAGDRLFGEHPLRKLADPGEHVAQRVADEHVGQTVAIEVGDRHMRDLGTLVCLRPVADRLRREHRRRFPFSGCARAAGSLWRRGRTGPRSGESERDHTDREGRQPHQP